MNAISLKSHSRGITRLRFNREGDLLISSSNDREACLWSTVNIERIGTYNHSNAVKDIIITNDSEFVLSIDALGNIYKWKTMTGELVATLDNSVSSKVVAGFDVSLNDEYLYFTYILRVLKKTESAIMRVKISDMKRKGMNLNEIAETVFESTERQPNFLKLTNLDTEMFVTTREGWLMHVDIEKKEVIKEVQVHTGLITEIDLSLKHECIMTTSKDKTAKIINPDNFEVFKELKPGIPERFINCGKFTPLISSDDANEQKFHCLIAGGQDARDVAGTSGKEGGFEILIYHCISGKELGSILGHFGTVNTLAISPDGKTLVTGAEDSTIRLLYLDKEYDDLDS